MCTASASLCKSGYLPAIDTVTAEHACPGPTCPLNKAQKKVIKWKKDLAPIYIISPWLMISEVKNICTIETVDAVRVISLKKFEVIQQSETEAAIIPRKCIREIITNEGNGVTRKSIFTVYIPRKSIREIITNHDVSISSYSNEENQRIEYKIIVT